jgi:hypothetical protein
VPIGLASLKSYVEDNAQDVKVKTIDLSLDFVNKVIDGEVKKICDVCTIEEGFEKNPFQSTLPQEFISRFTAARDLVKDQRLFYDKQLFVHRIRPLYLFLWKYAFCFSLVLRHYLEGRIRDTASILDSIEAEVKGTVGGNPDLVGFSVLTNPQLTFSLATAKMVKETFDIPVLLGGPSLYNFDLNELMNTFDFIDFIVVKEGEEALLGLTNALEGDGDFHDVPNLIWRKGETIVFNKEKLMKNLDTLPTPDFSDFRLNEYFFPELILPVSSARDCPWNLCKFCQLNAQYGGKYRQRSIEKVVNDIRVLQEKYDVRNFFFTDSEITANRLKEIGHALAENELEIYFGCYARPTRDLNLQVMQTAYAGGCRFIQLGVESLNDKYLTFVNKGTSRESIVTALKNADIVGINLLCYMLAGIPAQTRADLLTDMKAIATLQQQYNIFSVMYCLYNLGNHQPFYVQRQNYGIELRGRRIAFSTTASKIVHTNESLPYTYEDRSAYYLLRDCDRPDIDSPTMAVNQISKWVREFGINQDNLAFIFSINDFIFETQLLYSKERTNPNSKGFF